MAEPTPASSESTPPPKQSYSTDPALYIYTSLTSGSSHIVTATSRLETILKANRVPFKALDIATDEKARMLWGRRAGKDESGRVRKIPGLVQMGLVLGDLVEIEDWNEYGELKQHVKIYFDAYTTPAKGTPVPTPNITPAKKPTASSAAGASKATTVSESAKSPLAVAPTKLQDTKTDAKPAPVASEEPKTDNSVVAGAVPTAFAIAMKQASAEAAQKAKDSKKKAKAAPTPSLDGTGTAEPDAKPTEATKSLDTTEAKPNVTPSAGKSRETGEDEEDEDDDDDEDEKHVHFPTPIPAPTSSSSTTTTKNNPSSPPTKNLAALSLSENATAAVAAMQSPTSTAWRGGISKFNKNPVKTAAKDGDNNDDEDDEDDEDDDDDEAEEEEHETPKSFPLNPRSVIAPAPGPSIMKHRGSDVGAVSPEVIEAVEKREAIPEEREKEEDAVEE